MTFLPPHGTLLNHQGSPLGEQAVMKKVEENEENDLSTPSHHMEKKVRNTAGSQEARSLGTGRAFPAPFASWKFEKEDAPRRLLR